jgi:hypothetical protein
MKAGWTAVRKRLGPVGLSLAAAAITAAGLAAYSVAADDNKDGGSIDVAGAAAPGGPEIMLRAHGVSEEDEQKLENFRQCMEDQGLPAPPRFREGEDPPEPPSGEEFEQMRERLEQAHGACKDELPERLRELPPPPFGLGHRPCGPPSGLRDGDSDESGNGENLGQSFQLPAPPPGPTT